jgi:hypothetical protein
MANNRHELDAYSSVPIEVGPPQRLASVQLDPLAKSAAIQLGSYFVCRFKLETSMRRKLFRALGLFWTVVQNR